jgi:hypothetical protein
MGHHHHHGHQGHEAPPEEKATRAESIRHVVETVIIILSSFALAAAIPDITIVFGNDSNVEILINFFEGFIGSIGSMFSNYILPPLFYLILGKREPLYKKLGAILLMIIGSAAGIAGTAVLTWKTIEQFK